MLSIRSAYPSPKPETLQGCSHASWNMIGDLATDLQSPLILYPCNFADFSCRCCTLVQGISAFKGTGSSYTLLIMWVRKVRHFNPNNTTLYHKCNFTKFWRPFLPLTTPTDAISPHLYYFLDKWIHPFNSQMYYKSILWYFMKFLVNFSTLNYTNRYSLSTLQHFWSGNTHVTPRSTVSWYLDCS